MSRDALLRSLFDTTGFGLEVGPSHNPLLPKSAGYRVETIDHDTADGLRRKYANDKTVDLARIENVDYVSDGRPLAEIIPRRGEYDFIFASHVIEHLPDLLGFLLDCEQLLKPQGKLVLAVPDKRHCFDLLQQISSIGQVLQAHVEKRMRLSPGAIFDYFAYACRRGHITWSAGSDAPISFVHGLAEAREKFDRVLATNDYLDAHAWRFTPASFRLIISDLQAAGFTALREDSFHPSVGFEFYITLSAMGAGCPLDRLALCRQVIAEMQEVVLDKA